MGAEYDPATHSKARLGMAGAVPVVPVMPTGAQVSAQTGMLHLRLLGESYVRAGLPSVTPQSYKKVVKAIRACSTEPSYSGTGSEYFRLNVEPLHAPGSAGFMGARLWAGAIGYGVVVGFVAVWADAEIVSADQSLQEQLQEGEGDAGTGDGIVSPPQSE